MSISEDSKSAQPQWIVGNLCYTIFGQVNFNVSHTSYDPVGDGGGNLDEYDEEEWNFDDIDFDESECDITDLDTDVRTEFDPKTMTQDWKDWFVNCVDTENNDLERPTTPMFEEVAS